MKKLVLGLFCFSGLSAAAQSFTVDDTLSAGDSHIYYTADSNAVNLDAVTGAGVTWDYSTLWMYAGSTQLDTVKYASDSPDFSDYPNASYHDDLAGGISHYYSNTADSVVSYGFVFSAQGNNVKVMHDIDPQKNLELPMNLNDTFTDSTYGSVDISGSVSPTAGDVVVIADGTGTLNLGGSTFSNTIRIKMVEAIEGTITVPFPATGTVTRTTYTYYDFTVQNEPLLIHSTINVSIPPAINENYSAVYSGVALTPAGIEESVFGTFEVYPNPAVDIATITTEYADQLVIVNALGQTVVTINNPQNIESVDVSKFESGVYYVNVQKGENAQTKKLIIK